MRGEFGKNYQFGHCHYFAKYLIEVFKKLIPDADIKYHLILAKRLDDDNEVIDEVLVHAYLKINEFLIDSEGVNDINSASEREKEWANKEKDLTPDGYDFIVWEETTDEIPEIFFNKYCSNKHLKQDVKDFINRFDVQSLINKII